MISLFKVAPKCRAEGLSCALGTSWCDAPYGKMHMLDGLHSGVSYRAAGHGLNVNK